MDQSLLIVFVDNLLAKAKDIHSLARHEMLYLALYLRRASCVIRTIVASLAGIAHKGRATFGAMCGKGYRSGIRLSAVFSHSHYLRDYLAALFHIHEVAFVKIETLDEVLIVECGASDCSSGKMHGVHICHGSDGACATHLICHLEQACAGALRLVFVCYGPSRRLGRHAERTLLAQGVDLEHYAVGGHGQILALRVPIGYKLHYLLQSLHLLHSLRHLESPPAASHKVLVMSVFGQILAEQIIQIGIESACRHYARVLQFQSA